MAALCLFPGLFISQIFGNFMRGLIHGTGCSFMIDKEINLNHENDNNKKAKKFLEESFNDEDFPIQ